MRIARNSEVRELTADEHTALIRATEALDALMAHTGPDLPGDVAREYDAAIDDLARYHLSMHDLLTFRDEYHGRTVAE